jgi:hypothetical protein
METEDLVGVEIKTLRYLAIEADDISSAFSIFKRKLEEKEIFVNQYTNINELILEEEKHKDDIVKKFIISTKYIEEPVVWGGLYAEAKDNTLIKKFTINNIVQSGTKKWETRYVLIGENTKTRYDDSPTTKGDALEKAKEIVLTAKEDISIQVEKVLVSHEPSVAMIKYIKDKTEHNNIYIFMCNIIEFDENSFNTLYEENTELDTDTNQYKIKVDTIFEYDKRIKL